jgi:hypothetical protein
MDATGVAVQSNAFLDWFQTWGQVVYICLQMAYWIIVAWAATFAALQAKRFVDYKLGKLTASEPTAEAVAVEEFVD